MRRIAAAGILAALTLSACQPSADTIKLGFIGPLTGDAAAQGADLLNGVKMAIDEVNAKGGVNGLQVELVAEDGKCNGADAASAAQKLVNVDHVAAILGGQCSGETLAAAPITEAAKMILLSSYSSSPKVADAGDYVFRDYPNDALKTKAISKYLKDNGYKKMAIITENTDFAAAFREALLADVGTGAVVFDETVEPGTKDFRSLLTRLKDVDFDVFFPNTQTDSAMAVLMQQLRDQGFTQQAITHDVGDSVTLGQLAPEAVEGMFVVNVPTFGEGGTFESAYVAKFGTPQSTIALAAHAYDATNLLLQAITLKGTDGTAIKDYFYGLPSYNGVIGSFHFDKNGDVVGVPYALKKFQSGSTVTVSNIVVDQ
jgi:branched-chain amino acid transport system substrate-binding protein